MRPYILCAQINDGRSFLITVTGHSKDEPLLRTLFSSELAKVVRPHTLTTQAEGTFQGLAEIGVLVTMFQIRCRGDYTDGSDNLTAEKTGSTVQPS